MAARDVPEPWADWLRKGGLVDPRNGAPSMTRLAEAADIHASTISAMMYGTRATKPETIDRAADAISDAWRLTESDHRLSMRSQVHRAVGRVLRATEPFDLHPDADLLTPAERKVVNELIRLLASSKKAVASATVTPIKRAAREGTPNLPK